MSEFLDLTDVEASEPKVSVPPGKYKVFCTDAELKPTKSGTGKYIGCKFEIGEPSEFKGKTVFHNFNVANENPEAVRIGKEQLKSMLVAAGKTNFKLASPADLCGCVMEVMLTVDERGYNKIRYFVTDDSFEAVESAVGKTAKASEKKASKSTPAWG